MSPPMAKTFFDGRLVQALRRSLMVRDGGHTCLLRCIGSGSFRLGACPTCDVNAKILSDW
jgi:hypothetical protein